MANLTAIYKELDKIFNNNKGYVWRDKSKKVAWPILVYIVLHYCLFYLGQKQKRTFEKKFNMVYW